MTTPKKSTFIAVFCVMVVAFVAAMLATEQRPAYHGLVIWAYVVGGAQLLAYLQGRWRRRYWCGSMSLAVLLLTGLAIVPFCVFLDAPGGRWAHGYLAVCVGAFLALIAGSVVEWRRQRRKA
jgi:peptidoglycan/LPS O-acetylase OafA/YrhL